MSDFVRLDQLSERHAKDLLELYQREWWTTSRSTDDIRRMLRHSDVVVGFAERATNRLVAFARALTDCTFKALIFDVIVAREHRHVGLGRTLMEAIVTHPELAEVRHLELYCLPEMVPFYERWGFSTDLGGVRLMRLTRRGREV